MKFLVMLALEVSETTCIIRSRISEAISFYLIYFLQKRINLFTSHHVLVLVNTDTTLISKLPLNL